MKPYTPPGILKKKCEGPPVCLADDESHVLFAIIVELFGPCALTRQLSLSEVERIRKDPRLAISSLSDFKGEPKN